MSRHRQLVTILSGLFLLALSGMLASGIDGTRRYLVAQLGAHAQDAASALGLSLSSPMATNDLPVMESMVEAMLDGGSYREIIVRSATGERLITRMSRVRVDRVPRWFVRWLPLPAPAGEAGIMSGWRQGGTVSVKSHPGDAYEQLWSSAVESLAWSAGTLLAVAALLGAFVLRGGRSPPARVAAAERELRPAGAAAIDSRRGFDRGVPRARPPARSAGRRRDDDPARGPVRERR